MVLSRLERVLTIDLSFAARGLEPVRFISFVFLAVRAVIAHRRVKLLLEVGSE